MINSSSTFIFTSDNVVVCNFEQFIKNIYDFCVRNNRIFLHKVSIPCSIQDIAVYILQDPPLAENNIFDDLRAGWGNEKLGVGGEFF